MYQTLIQHMAADVKKLILDTLFPITCLSCNREGVFLCPECQSLLTKLEHQRCIVCQKPTPFAQTHPKCQTSHGADGLISFYDYHDEKVAKIIIGGKYSFLPDVYKLLGEMVAKKLTEYYPHLLTTSYHLIPIPLASSRQRWRGFNQAEVLCQAISAELNLPIADVLVRQKNTKTQKDLKKEDRLKNVAGVFAIKTKLPSPIHGEGLGEGLKSADVIRGKNIILVDDVTTTGATLQEAAKVLKINGAAQVICLTVARD